MSRYALLLAACFSLAIGGAAVGRAETGGVSTELSSPQRIEAEFLRGLRLLESGDPRAAAMAFRRILAEDPNLPRVRLELARAYYNLRSWRDSRAEFVAVLSSDVPAEVRRNILKFINAIDARRGFDWNAAVGLSLGPEFGRRYKTDTVYLDFFGNVLPFTVDRQTSDSFGVSFEGAVEIRRPLFDFGGAGPMLVGFVTGGADIFDASGVRSDDFVFSSAVGSRLVWRQTTANAAANATVRHKSGEIYDDRLGASASLEYRSEAGFAPLASMSYSAVNVHNTDILDGDLFGVSAGFSKSIFGSANVGAVFSAEHFGAERDYESYDALKFSLIGSADIGAGFSGSLQASLRRSRYLDSTPLFTDRRVDNQFDLNVEINKKDLYILSNFSPFLRVGYTYNESTIDIFSFDEYRFLIGLKNAF